MNARNACRMTAVVLLLVAALAPVRAFAQADGEVATIVQRIRAADASASLEELAAVVRAATDCCADSAPLSLELTRLLRENHPVYSGRLPTDANRFRGFLLASLGAFPANDELYATVKAELRFGGHAFDVAAAAVAARGFADRAGELVPLLEPFLADTFMDMKVDVTTPRLDYPLAHATTARREVIRTLVAYGASAARLAPMLDAIERCPNCGTYASDETLPALASDAARRIRASAPHDAARDARVSPDARASIDTPASAGAPALQLIDARQRRAPVVKSLPLVDQEGSALKFADLHGRPFALSFLYSRCANPQKCVLTVRQLGMLASECADSGLAARVGVYGVTYDPEFDSPTILKRFGSMYGLKFGENVRLFKTTDGHSAGLRDELALRVSYGGGSVNHHGVQLFVFDKKGRLAAMQDNEAWSPADVRGVLANLAAE